MGMYKDLMYLELADRNAKQGTGCLKVDVGCIITNQAGTILGEGVNTSNPCCKDKGICHRIELYGENSKLHRLPSDCNSVHSEINAIIDAGRKGKSCEGGIAYITRYPCEACARALVQAGIKKVVYGRTQEISELTKEVLKGVKVVWRKDWDSKDVID